MTRCWVMAIWSFSHSDRRTDTGDRRPDIGYHKWFYILSNATIQCTGQTKMFAVSDNIIISDIRWPVFEQKFS